MTCQSFLHQSLLHLQNIITGAIISIEYQNAWLHHKGHNKHHWEYWVDWKSSNGEYIITEIPLKFMKEMYADMGLVHQKHIIKENLIIRANICIL